MLMSGCTPNCSSSQSAPVIVNIMCRSWMPRSVIKSSFPPFRGGYTRPFGFLSTAHWCCKRLIISLKQLEVEKNFPPFVPLYLVPLIFKAAGLTFFFFFKVGKLVRNYFFFHGQTGSKQELQKLFWESFFFLVCPAQLLRFAEPGWTQQESSLILRSINQMECLCMRHAPTTPLMGTEV